jgi:hypothetical protein
VALIKITYVSELQVEGELINFSIPGSVAPWKQETSNTEVREITLFNFTVNIWNRTLIYVIGSVPMNSKFFQKWLICVLRESRGHDYMVVGLVAGWWFLFSGHSGFLHQ